MLENGLSGECLVAGTASGQVLSSGVPLSFWGGVDPFTGMITDKHHPLLGHNLRGKVLAIPGGRGSCGGSGVILELLRNGNAPAALVFCRPEMILTVGAVIASEMFDRRIPVLRLDLTDFARLQAMPAATLVDGAIGPADTPGLSFACPS